MYTDLMTSQFQNWPRLIKSLILALIQSYDHVTFYTFQPFARLGQDLQV